jgi:large subunit ribosomal protein L4
MKLKVLNITSNKTSIVDISDTIFNKDYNESLVNQVSTAYMAKYRSGTKAQKNRSAVRGGGRKPFAQKGSGRARAGTIRSPIWRSGGVTFVAKPRDYSKKVNKKMYQGAMRVIFSNLLKNERLIIINELVLEKPSTKSVIRLIKLLKINDVLFVTDLLDDNLYLSTRNLYYAGAIDVANINPISLIGYQHIVLTKAALTKIQSWL